MNLSIKIKLRWLVQELYKSFFQLPEIFYFLASHGASDKPDHSDRSFTRNLPLLDLEETQSRAFAKASSSKQNLALLNFFKVAKKPQELFFIHALQIQYLRKIVVGQ